MGDVTLLSFVCTLCFATLLTLLCTSNVAFAMNQDGEVPQEVPLTTGIGEGSEPAVPVISDEPQSTTDGDSQAGFDVDGSEMASEDAARESLMADVRDYQRSIERIEQQQGAYAAGLSEQLLSLGLALQRNGEHGLAIDAFKRGAHLARINEGLYSTRQMALLQGEIASHIALGAFETADERQRYLYRVQAETLSDVSRGQAFMQHAVWQRQAYEAGIGEDPFSRLTRMYSLYRLALTEFVASEGNSSPLLLPPLYGMLRAQYLISGFVGETSSGRFRDGAVLGEEESRQMAYGNLSYKEGTSVIRAIFDVTLAMPEQSIEDRAKISMMLGDWQFWHGKRKEAFETYGLVYRELADADDAQALSAGFFDTPQALPALEGVRALPDREEESEGHLLLEFGVSERGRVTDLTRLDEFAANDAKADSIMRRLRQTPFRPRISDGMPVETKGLRWAYDTSNW
ncbi:MAG: hypothetical protein Cons2KO_27630 [Congregibacter sp.]